VTMRAMSSTSPRPTHRSILLAAMFVAFLGLAVGPVSHPAPAQASTATYMEGLIVKWVNNARENRGVRPLRVTTKLTDLAGARAATLARTANLVHPSCLSCTFRAYSVSFSTCGEDIAMTSYPWGYQAARSIYNAWRGSPGHWTILMSGKFGRIGVGVAYRSSGGTTWASADLAG